MSGGKNIKGKFLKLILYYMNNILLLWTVLRGREGGIR